MVKEGLIKEERKSNLRYFKANINSMFFKHLKIAFNINILLKSRLIEFLKNEITNISAIVLFGSMAKGEDDKKSDVDILIIGKEKHLNLTKFEDKIGREITLHTFNWSRWNKEATKNKAFYFEAISHGIALFGELPLIK